MLKRIGLIGAVLAAMLMAGAGMVTAQPAQAEGKFAVVDTQTAINDCNAGKKAQVALKAKHAKLKDSLSRLEAQVRKLRSELENTAMLLKPEAKVRKEQEFNSKASEFRDKARAAEQELIQAKRALFEPIIKRMAAIIKGMGKAGNYTLIVDSHTAIYYPQSVDITAQVISAYNKQFPK